MSYHVTIRHNFEAGHRLPHLPGKCQSLHGHSWWATITVSSEDLVDGLVVDFGSLKAGLRGWIDVHLDHGLMLGWLDPLAEIMPEHGKVFRFEPEHGDWPTVENVAVLLAGVTRNHLDDATGRVSVTRVTVTETSANEATWTA